MTDGLIRMLGADATELSDDEIVALYAPPPGRTRWTRVNFVSSIDGAVTVGGLSGGLSDAADHRVFDLLRTLCDVIVVGAGTVRSEGYGPMRVRDDAVKRRLEAGRAPQPVFALVSARLALDPTSRIFTDAPVRPIVVTSAGSPEDRRAALAEVADVIVCGDEMLDTSVMIDRLVDRGLSDIHCEGGPHLFGTMVGQDTVDELCLTISPLLEGGSGGRITAVEASVPPLKMRLEHTLVAESTLLLRYLRSA